MAGFNRLSASLASHSCLHDAQFNVCTPSFQILLRPMSLGLGGITFPIGRLVTRYTLSLLHFGHEGLSVLSIRFLPHILTQNRSIPAPLTVSGNFPSFSLECLRFGEFQTVGPFM